MQIVQERSVWSMTAAVAAYNDEAPWSSGRTLALDAARPRSIPGLGHY